MFNKNDFVIYGTEGVCQIIDVREIEFCHASANEKGKKLYYVLMPIRKKDTTVYVPTASERLCSRMRRIMKKEEIDAAIDTVKRQAALNLNDRKKRIAIYRDVSESTSCEKLLILIKSLYERRQKLISEGKKLSFSDAEMLLRCEGMIADEFSFSLNIESDAVGAYIQNRFQN